MYGLGWTFFFLNFDWIIFPPLFMVFSDTAAFLTLSILSANPSAGELVFQYCVLPVPAPFDKRLLTQVLLAPLSAPA